jgi:hypothetical protein
MFKTLSDHLINKEDFFFLHVKNYFVSFSKTQFIGFNQPINDFTSRGLKTVQLKKIGNIYLIKLKEICLM